MATLYMTREEYEKKYGVKAPTTSSMPSSASATPQVLRMTREEYQQKYGVPAPIQAPTPRTHEPIVDNSWNAKLMRGEPTFDINRNDGIGTNLARYTGNIPGSVVNLVRNAVAPVNPFDLDHPLNIGSNLVKMIEPAKDLLEQNDGSATKASLALGKSMAQDAWSLYKKLGEKALQFGVDRMEGDTMGDALKATGYTVAEVLGKVTEAVMEDPTIIPTLLYTPGKLTDKYGKLRMTVGTEGNKVYRNAADEVVSVVDKKGQTIYGTNVTDDMISKVAKPVIQGTKAVAEKVGTKIVGGEAALDTALNKTASIYRDALPFTPTQRAKEAAQLAKTGDDTASVLAKNGIELGSGNEMVQLEQLKNLYKKADEAYQKTETALFDVQKILTKFDEHIDKVMKVPSSRVRAKTKIKMEVKRLLDEPSSKVNVVIDANGNILVRSELVERMRMMGNEIAKYKDMENIGRDMGFAFSNAVRDEIERSTSFAARRAMMRDYGNIINAENNLDAMFKAGKQFRRVGGLSGSIARKVLSGLFGYHMGGIPGAILAELGSEYAATVLSNPMMRTWYSRRVAQLIRGGDVSPANLEKLKSEINAYKAKVEESMQRGLALPAPSGKAAIQLGAKSQQPGVVTRAKKTFGRDPKTGRFKLVYTSESETKALNKKLQSFRDKKNKLKNNKQGGFIKNPFVRSDIKEYLPSNPRNRNLLQEAEAALEKYGFDAKSDIGALELIRTYLKPEKGDMWSAITQTELATAVDILNGTAKVRPSLLERAKRAFNNPKYTGGFARIGKGESSRAKALRTIEERQVVSSTNDTTFTRTRVGTTGQYIGAPRGVVSPQKKAALVKRLTDLSKKGEIGKDWYRKSAETIKELFPTKARAKLFAQLLAVYSPATDVTQNMGNALKAWGQWVNGQPIKAGRFSGQDKIASALLNDGKSWSGIKTNSFYKNLLKHIDPSDPLAKDAVTVDLWIMRAFGYDVEKPSLKQYEFAENIIRDIAKKTGNTPEQVQASIWLAVRSSKLNRALTKDDIMSFTEAAKKNYGQVSFESAPSKTSGLFPELHGAPWKAKMEYHAAMEQIFHDKNGRNVIFDALGIPQARRLRAPGVFEGQVSPGTQYQIPMPKQHLSKTGEIEQAFKDRLDIASAMMGKLAVQDAVAYHRPFWGGPKGVANGTDINIGRPLTASEAKAFDEVMTRLSGSAQYAPISTPRGFRVINFSELPNEELYGIIKKSVNEVFPGEQFGVDLQRFSSDGNYISNDWTKNFYGEDYRRILSKGPSDILGRLDREFSQKAESVISEFKAKYGWSDNRPGIRAQRGNSVSGEGTPDSNGRGDILFQSNGRDGDVGRKYFNLAEGGDNGGLGKAESKGVRSGSNTEELVNNDNYAHSMVATQELESANRAISMMASVQPKVGTVENRKFLFNRQIDEYNAAISLSKFPDAEKQALKFPEAVKEQMNDFLDQANPAVAKKFKGFRLLSNTDPKKARNTVGAIGVDPDSGNWTLHVNPIHFNKHGYADGALVQHEAFGHAVYNFLKDKPRAKINASLAEVSKNKDLMKKLYTFYGNQVGMNTENILTSYVIAYRREMLGIMHDATLNATKIGKELGWLAQEGPNTVLVIPKELNFDSAYDFFMKALTSKEDAVAHLKSVGVYDRLIAKKTFDGTTINFSRAATGVARKKMLLKYLGSDANKLHNETYARLVEYYIQLGKEYPKEALDAISDSISGTFAKIQQAKPTF
jgi:hypothetical protein